MPDPNKVTIYSKEITGIEYVPGTLKATAGQRTREPVQIASKGGGKWEITAYSGRSGSGEIAAEFTNMSGGVLSLICPSDWEVTIPREINFFFGVRITPVFGANASWITYLAQGHTLFRNNWWIGGDSVQRVLYNNVTKPTFCIGDGRCWITGDISSITLTKCE